MFYNVKTWSFSTTSDAIDFVLTICESRHYLQRMKVLWTALNLELKIKRISYETVIGMY